MNPIPRAGETFCERYRLEEVLGVGGIGTVFKAVQLDCQRTVALKILHPELASDEDFKKRFVREARALNDLQQSGIVTVYHIGVSDTGLPYIVMEYIHGQSIRKLLAAEGKLAVLRAVNITRQAAEALAYVHQHNIVHRDLKPENIITVEEPEPDTVKLIDFGLARILSEQRSTRTGTLIGSANYMSPEQCQGKPVDGRADIYSLAVCFYEMLTGEKPFEADNAMGLMYKHAHEAIPLIEASQVDRFHKKINYLLARAMSKQPQDRYQRMEELCQDLLQLEKTLEQTEPGGKSGGPPALPAGAANRKTDGEEPGHQIAKASCKSRKAAWCLCGLILSLAAAAAGYSYFCLPAREKPDPQADRAKLLSSAETMALPRTEEGMQRLVSSFVSQGKSSEIMPVLRRWEKKYLTSALVPLKAKSYVLTSMSNISAQSGDTQEASRCVEHLASIDHSPATQLFVASTRANLQRHQLHPEKGIEEIESVLHRLPSDQASITIQDALVRCLVVEADCYFDRGNARTAAELYGNALEITAHYMDPLDPTPNPIRCKAIVALKQIGNTAESNRLLTACLKAAEFEPGYTSRKQRFGKMTLLLNKDSQAAENGSTPLPAGSRSTARAGIFAQLSSEFLERGNLKDFKECADLAIQACTESGQTRLALDILGRQTSECGDYQTSVETAKRILRQARPDEFPVRINLLAFIATAYTYHLAQPAVAYDYEEKAFKLIQNQLDSQPDFLIKQPGIAYAGLLCCMKDNHLTKSDELSRKLDLLIDRCNGQDCESLRSLHGFKFIHLVELNKLDDALALCNDRLAFFAGVKPEAPVSLYDWLVKKGDIYNRKGNLSEALQEYRQAYKLIEPLTANEVRKTDVLLRMGNTLFVLKNNEEALKTFCEMEKTIDLYSSGTSGLPGKGECDKLLAFGLFCLNQGDFPRAAALYDRIEHTFNLRYGKDNQELIELLYWRGEMLRKQHKNSEAAEVFKKVASLCLKHHVNGPIYKQSLRILASLEKT